MWMRRVPWDSEAYLNELINRSLALLRVKTLLEAQVPARRIGRIFSSLADKNCAVEMDNNGPPDILHCSSRVNGTLCFLFIRAQIHPPLLAARRVDAQELLAEVDSIPLLLSNFTQVISDLIRVDNSLR